MELINIRRPKIRAFLHKDVNKKKCTFSIHVFFDALSESGICFCRSHLVLELLAKQKKNAVSGENRDKYPKANNFS